MTDPVMGQFLGACGLRGPISLEVRGPGASVPGLATQDRPFVLIGRDEPADLVLDHPEVSRRHAYLQAIAGRIFCVDLGSRSGTSWGGNPGLMGWVGRDRGVQIGPFSIRPAPGAGAGELATTTPGVDALPTSRAFRQSPAPPDVPNVLEAAGGRSSWRIGRALILAGRSRLCRVQLEGDEVSQVHCSLVRTPEGLWVVDLLSRRGIAVNGQPVRWSRLGDGDELRLGSSAFRLRVDHAPARIPPRPGRPTIGRIPDDLSGLADLIGHARGPLPDGSTHPEIVEALLIPLLNEIGRMQRAQAEMADQFQQTLLTTVQMFATMQQDQMGSIREELARIRGLADEQAKLQAELAKGRPAGEAVPSGPGKPREPAPAPAIVARRGDGPGAEPAPPALHVDLMRRLAAVQEERQGRWQRLLGAVTGKGSTP